MPLEPVNFLDDLVVTNPTDTDPVSEGDNHIRNLKIALAAGVTGDADETRLLVQGIARALAVATGLDIQTEVDQLLELRLLNKDAPDVGIALEMEATTGKGAIRETDGAGVAGNAWLVLTPAEGVALLFNDIIRIASTALGAQVDGSKIDLNDSLVDEATQYLQRNLIGGWRMLCTAATANMQIDETDEAGVIQNQAALFTKGGGFTSYFDGAQALRTVIGDAANSKGEVFDAGGLARPVGFNIMPIVTVSGNLSLDNSHNGVKIRSDNNAHTITLPNLLTGMTVVYINGSTSAVAADDTLSIPGVGRHYTGSGIVQRNGSTFALAPGCAATFTHAGGGTWEIWGNGIS